ncbi:CoA ester lyase [Pseudarthrobacter sp. AB1]|uniref:HpcH/HpaI aldolase/citrate lyase family protein n=1 Tax=Pseudarthrobacter sp. AB1 TaxID=2138309 RepID=UPI00186BB27A|nr:CoA ester lyase [Pseudarthrobacter sp. AB1]MBE4717890.1 CoA ester lyase [Pseudarthrobacter sp. AB1]
MIGQSDVLFETPGIELVAAAVTALFVPGDRPERFAKAAASGAGVVIADLEDAVAPVNKAKALAAVVDSLTRVDLRALVRINPLGTESSKAEIVALLNVARQAKHGLLGLVIPKAEDSLALRNLASRCELLDLAVVPLIETAVGVIGAADVAGISGITRLSFGAIDYALDIDAGTDDRFLDHARSALVVSSRAAGIPAPLDSPAIYIKEIEKVQTSAKLARGFGFGGKLCIHPSQVPVVNQAFRPGPDEVEWAESVVSAAGGASQIEGQMIDRPVIERAQRILARTRKEN